MNRDQYKTVTGFVLLVPASESDAMGEATFASEAFGRSHVRPIMMEEIKKAASVLKGVEAAHFGAMLALRGALESGDRLARAQAMERMQKVYRLRQAGKARWPDADSERIFGQIFAPSVGLSPEETVRYMEGLRFGPKAATDLQRLLSYEVSEAVGPLLHANIVLWWFKNAFRPAIYCMDAKAALYVHTFFLAPNGEVGFRICPYDGEQFFQDRANQEYCCPAHREAHRVARFRDNKRRNNEERGKHHGTQKAR
jgi:hypothetical protein